MKKNIFVVGLDDFNLRMIRAVKNGENYNIHRLLDIQLLIDSGKYRLHEMLELADSQLRKFDGPIDAIVGYTDFPVSTIVTVLCGRFNVPGPSLESVLKCEHKYWSRLEQKKAIPECIPGFIVFNPFDTNPLEQIPFDYPFWIKPVKSTGSQLGFRIKNKKDFNEAIRVLRANIGLFKPFDQLLDMVQLPPEVAKVNSSYCLAEQIISGRQCTLEGYVFNGQVGSFGIVDSIREPNRTSFARYQYPSLLPKSVRDQMSQITEKIISHIGFDNSAFNIEFFWNKRDDKVWLLEINTRISQSHSDLFMKVDGVSNHQIMLDVALGKNPWFPERQGKFKVAGKFFLREYQDKLITGIPAKEDVEALNEIAPGVLVDILGKAGMKLSDIPEQDSYSYASAFIFLGAMSQKELLEKFSRCRQLLKFQYQDLVIPAVSVEKVMEKHPDAEPEAAIQITAMPAEVPFKENEDQAHK